MIRKVFSGLLHYVPGGKTAFIVSAVSGVVSGICESVSTIAIVRVASGLSRGKSGVGNLPGPLGSGSITFALLLAAVCTLMAIVAEVLSIRVNARAHAGTLFNAREAALRAFSDARWSVQAEQRDGALHEALTSQSASLAMLTSAYSGLAVSSLTILTTLAVAVVVDPAATLVVVVAGYLLTRVLRPISRGVRTRSSANVALSEDFAEEVQVRTLMAMETRLFGVEEAAHQIVSDINEKQTDHVAKMKFGQWGSAMAQRQLAIVAVIIGLSAVRSLSTDAIVATGTVVLLMIRALQPAQSLQAALQQVNEHFSTLSKFENRLAVLVEGKESPGHRSIDTFEILRLEKVAYVYANGREALRGVDLEVRSGEMVGLVGPSGGGKSTVKQVIARMRLPTTGRVLVNGIPYEEFDHESWSRAVSLVPQAPQMFPGSLFDNIRFLREYIDDERIVECAKAAFIHDEIMALPHGYETRLGPRGSGLSGGQRQRIGIARALAAAPQLLVLDEPTSALDKASEEMIKRTIAALKGKMTLIVIAHRTSTLEACDRILTMRDGRIVDQTT